MELERLDLAGLELERRADGLGVDQVRQDVGRLGRRAVGDRARDRLAGQELHAAGGEVDAAAEARRRLAERDAEVEHADAQVVELDDAGEADLLRRGRGDRRRRVVRPRRDLARLDVGRRLARLVAQLRAAEVEAVLVDHEAGLDLAVDRDGRDHAGDAEARELDHRRLQDDELLLAALVLRRVVVRVVVDAQAGAGRVEDVRDRRPEAADLEAPLAGRAEGLEQLRRVAQRARRLGDVDRHVERALDLVEEHARAAVLLLRLGVRRRRRSAACAAEGEARLVHLDRDRDDERAALEGHAREADGRVDELERPDARARALRGRAGQVVRVDRERAGRAARVRERVVGLLDLPGGAGAAVPADRDEADVDRARREHVLLREARLRPQEVAVRVRGDELRRRRAVDEAAADDVEVDPIDGAGQLDLVAVDALEHAAGEARVEDDVDVRPRRELVEVDDRAVERARQLRRRHRRGRRHGRGGGDAGRRALEVDAEELVLADVLDAARVLERVREEADLDGVERVGVLGERPGVAVVEEVRVRRVLRRAAVDDDVRRGAADERELGRRVEDRVGVHRDRHAGRRVDVEVAEEDVDRPGQRVHVDALAVERLRQVGDRGAQLGGRRRQRDDLLVEQLEAGDAPVDELEALAAAEREARVALEREDLGQVAAERHRDLDRGVEHLGVDDAVRLDREADRAAQREDPGHADRQLVRGRRRQALRGEAGLELLHVAVRGERHHDRLGGRAAGGRQRDRVDDRLARAVDQDADRAADRQALEPDQRGGAGREDRERVVGRDRRVVVRAGELDDADGRARDEHADRVGVDRAVGVAVRAGAEEQLDVLGAVDEAVRPRVAVRVGAAEREVAAQRQERREVDRDVAERQLERVGRHLDAQRRAADGDRLVDGGAQRVDLQDDLAARAHDRRRHHEAAAEDARDAVRHRRLTRHRRVDDESALAVRQRDLARERVEERRLDAHLGRADLEHLARLRARADRQLLDREVAVERDRVLAGDLDGDVDVEHLEPEHRAGADVELLRFGGARQVELLDHALVRGVDRDGDLAGVERQAGVRVADVEAEVARA